MPPFLQGLGLQKDPLYLSQSFPVHPVKQTHLKSPIRSWHSVALWHCFVLALQSSILVSQYTPAKPLGQTMEEKHSISITVSETVVISDNDQTTKVKKLKATSQLLEQRRDFLLIFMTHARHYHVTNEFLITPNNQ